MNLIYINNLNDLMEDLSKYREMFPESYTRYSEIKETLFYRQKKAARCRTASEIIQEL